jgi:hypothetical protein
MLRQCLTEQWYFVITDSNLLHVQLGQEHLWISCEVIAIPQLISWGEYGNRKVCFTNIL